MAKTWMIERAKPTDAEDIQKLLRTVWMKTYPNEEFNVTVEDIESKQFLSKEIIKKRREILSRENPKRIDFAVWQNRKLIGWCAAEQKNHFGQIMTIYIHPDYQGNGIGMALMKKAVEWLREFDLIVVEVAIYNKKAIKFYKRFGFRETVVKSEYKFPNGKTIPTTMLGIMENR